MEENTLVVGPINSEIEERRQLLKKRMNIFMSLGQYKRANAVAHELGLEIKIQDAKGTEYYIDKNGSVRRTIPKKRRRR